MTSENFCYWLHGWFELNKTINHHEVPTKETLKVIEDHLDLVFNKVTPKRAEQNIALLEAKPTYCSKVSSQDTTFICNIDDSVHNSSFNKLYTGPGIAAQRLC